MKKWGMLAILVAAGCGLAFLTPAVQAGETMDKIEKSGKIKVGFREDSIPFAFIDPKVGKQVGFSVDMAGILAENLSKYFGKKIEIEPVTITGKTRIPMIINGTTDVEMGFNDIGERGFADTVADRTAWGRMRMSPVDLADVTAYTYTYLMNGHSPDMNWTALFNPGETIRLRFINASTTTNYDVRIPGLDMEVVMADGKAVRPVLVHEFRIGVAETYDVLVRTREDRAFTLFAESLDRSGYTRGTLTPEAGMEAPVPALRPRPVRRLEDIGMGSMAHGGMAGMDHGKMGDGNNSQRDDPRIPGPNGPTPFKPDKGNTNVAMVIMNPKYRLDEPGLGLGEDGWRVLTYDDLVSTEPQPYSETVDREMTINITANMERYMFSFDGKKFSEHPGPYLFRHNERLRLFLVNHTMMEHPIHLHGMWMQLENGADKLPFKHTILTKPGEVLSTLITPIEKGDWAFHCHLLYHMKAGMFQVVRVA